MCKSKSVSLWCHTCVTPSKSNKAFHKVGLNPLEAFLDGTVHLCHLTLICHDTIMASKSGSNLLEAFSWRHMSYICVIWSRCHIIKARSSITRIGIKPDGSFLGRQQQPPACSRLASMPSNAQTQLCTAVANLCPLCTQLCVQENLPTLHWRLPSQSCVCEVDWPQHTHCSLNL